MLTNRPSTTRNPGLTHASTRVRTLLTIAVLLTVSPATATAAPAAASPASTQQVDPVSLAGNPGTPCPPAGFLRSPDVGAPLGAIVKNGETLYCVANEFSWKSKSACVKYLPAEEYIRHKTGRPDAIYSGMGLLGLNPDIILFYCLPRARKE